MKCKIYVNNRFYDVIENENPFDSVVISVAPCDVAKAGIKRYKAQIEKVNSKSFRADINSTELVFNSKGNLYWKDEKAGAV